MRNLLALMIVLLGCQAAWAVPPLVNYQGTYVNNAGVPVTQASAPVVISIWDHVTSTSLANRKYQENHTVNISDGNFSLKIGSGSSPVGTFGADLFNTPGALYLQLRINGEDMLPRVRFLSAPYTLQAENARLFDNQTTTAFEERLCRSTPGSKWISSLPLCIGGSVNLSDRDLTGLDLNDVQLIGAEVNETKFDTVNLRNSYLRNLQYAPGKNPGFDGASLRGATLTHWDSMTGIKLNYTDLLGLYANELGSCPDELPADWYCVSADNNDNQPPFRLIGPGARFSDDPHLPAASWNKTNFPQDLRGINFRGNYFVDCSFSGNPNFTNTNFFGAHFENCAPVEAIWDNTICPDGTNSGTNGKGNCLENGF